MELGPIVWLRNYAPFRRAEAGRGHADYSPLFIRNPATSPLSPPAELVFHQPCAAMSTASLYPRYCFHLSPTFDAWCLLHAREIHRLEQHEGFQAENFFFHGNLPIRWVRVVGIVVAVDDFDSRRVYTVDDSSGACIEALLVLLPAPMANSGKGQDKATADCIHVGSVVDVKGELSTYRDEKQIKIERIKRLRSTADELALWERRATFRRDVLDRPWVLARADIRRCRREAERSEAAVERKKRRRAGTAVTRGTGRQQEARQGKGTRDDVAAHVRDMIRTGELAGKYHALGL
ncbi:hypothetical protein XA68_18455 [Ophiocordyceps unilateralis]|uniref:CST complex subunit Stn1 N-terminal domain-containing protein n=1 Tax=Ophiocordyceps unilateralis TaxID=268505 RepID=A0A2A9PJ99_OPHUN|nr:hypothetical protein XA68_18455 [Ophiocordyceps unilateralis]